MNLTQKMLKVATDVGHVSKTGVNKHQGFNFRGIDAVVNAISPALQSNGVLVYPTVLHYEYVQVEIGQNKSLMGHARLEVRYTFTDGVDTISATVAGEAMDSGDKATAKAMSVAFRTALLQTFCLPTDEADPDESTYKRSDHAPAPKAPGTRPITARAAEHEEQDDEPFPSKPSRPVGLATEKQKAYITDLAKKRAFAVSFVDDFTYDDASALIDELKQMPVVK